MTVLPSMFPALTTPLSVGQFVGGALAGTVAETQVALGCAMIARACDVYSPPAEPDAVSLQPTPADIKGLVELFREQGRRSEVAPRLTESAATIAAIVSAAMSTGQEILPPPPPSVPRSLIDQGSPPPGFPRPVRARVVAYLVRPVYHPPRHASGPSWWQRLFAFFGIK